MITFQYKIIGTSHVSEDSVKQIEFEIQNYKPDFVCVELDRSRLQGLLSKQKSSFSPKLIMQIGLFGYLFGLIGSVVQKKIGKSLNIVPGSDMLVAVKTAKKYSLPVYLIDQEISVTLRNISKNFKFREKMKLVREIFSSLLFPRRAMKKVQRELGITKIDLQKVPDDEIIEKMIGKLKQDYPGLYKALVGDRNFYMSKKMVNLMKEHPDKKVLAIVGAGHKKEMDDIIKKKLLNIEYIGKNI